MNNSPEDPGGYSSAAFGSLCTAISPRRAARFDRQFVLSCGRNRKFKLSRIHIIAEINRFIDLRSDDNIDPSLFNFKLNRNHITRFGIDNMCIGFAHPREPQEEIILIFYAVPVKNFGIATCRSRRNAENKNHGRNYAAEQHAFFLTLLFLRSKTFAQTGGTNPLLTLNTSKPVLIFNTDTVLLFAVFVNIDPRNNDLRKALIFPSVGIGTAYSSPP